MSLESAMRQKAAQQAELPLDNRGEAPTSQRSGEAPTAANGDEGSGNDRLMERVIGRSNMKHALKRVRQNKGSPGIDGMTVEELPRYLDANWMDLCAQLLAGTYQPRPVKRQEIPKAGGGVRQLGIPTAVDRFIQQAVLQVLQPMFDPTFSQHSYGFRPGRSAHQAVCAAQQHIQSGKRWVVDVDLEKFFDRVNHDVLMGKLAKRITDKRMLGLIRRYLEAGVMANGVVMARQEGTPQGGPLSPLLANVLLDEVDKELETRGLAFARYADDCNVYVSSRRAGEDVMRTLRSLMARLRLRINEAKSAVARPWDRKFLGYSFWVAKGKKVSLKVAPKALEAMKEKVRELTRRSRGRSLRAVVNDLRSYLVGWRNYFQLANTPNVWNELDEWIRHRLRALVLKHWKRGRTVFRELTRRGVGRETAARIAANTRRWWRNSAMGIHIALPNELFERLGLPRLAG